jgi:hypothetical protein
MKRYFTLLLLTLPATAFAMGSAAAGPAPAGFFLGGWAVILVMLVRLSRKTRKTGDAGFVPAEVSSRYETSEFPIVVFRDSAHAGGRDS